MLYRIIYGCLAGAAGLVATGWILSQGAADAGQAGGGVAFAAHSGTVIRPQSDSLPAADNTYPGLTENGSDRQPVDFNPYLDWLRGEVREASLPGYALAIVSSEGVVDLQTSGVRNVEQGTPMTPDTVFRIASVSKTFAGTVASQLVANNVHSWDEPLHSILPQYSLGTAPSSSRNITLKHLMSHSTGLMPHAYSNMLDAGVAYRKIQEKFDEIPTVCNPGQCYGYQNVVFSLISDVVNKSIGTSYDDYVRQRIFQPLGMANASLGMDGFRSSPDVSAPHRRARGRWHVSTVNPAYFTVAPASGVNASIRDMSQWARANLGAFPDVVPRPVLEMQHAPVVETAYGGYYNRWSGLDKAWYGVGWRVFDYAGTRVLHHGGGVRGYRSEMVLVPELDLAMIVLFNAQTSLANDVVPQFLDTVLAQAQ